MNHPVHWYLENNVPDHLKRNVRFVKGVIIMTKTEMVKEILIFARFNAKNGWETWLITGISSLTFTCFIKSKNKKLVETLARRRQNSSFNK